MDLPTTLNPHPPTRYHTGSTHAQRRDWPVV